MPPNDSRRTSLNLPQRPYLQGATPNGGAQPARQQAAQSATAGIVRNQIETIYQDGARNEQAAQQLQQSETSDGQTPQQAAFAAASHNNPDSPYDRTHEADRTTVRTNQWKQYHSAWQNYYQQYYERYYIGEVYRMRQTLDAHIKPRAVHANHEEQPEQTADNDEAFHDLRADLLGNVRDSAVKVRNSRHFMPLLAAGLTMVLFLFLQYNRVLFANVEAYVSPGSINPANIIVDPNISIPVSNEPRLIIPKINIDVPVEYNTKPDQASQQLAMEKGVAWFGIPGANSRPGQIGNTVLSGHSSNGLFDLGDYKFIFVRLEQLTKGDNFYLNYKGKRYTYTVTKKEVVKPTDVDKLIYPTNKPVVTLITCVPIGTAQNRLLVTAEQISPSPSQAEAAPAQTDTSEAAAMPGNSPSFLNRLFGN